MNAACAGTETDMDKKKERRRRLFAELLSAVIVYLLADTKVIRLLEQRFNELCDRIYYMRHGFFSE